MVLFIDGGAMCMSFCVLPSPASDVVPKIAELYLGVTIRGQ